jgi:hypothetical protein
MRWIASIALIIALLSLAMHFSRSFSAVRDDARASSQRYQALRIGVETIIRRDTRTGEMVAFQVALRSELEAAKRELKDDGKLEFIELGRSGGKMQ